MKHQRFDESWSFDIKDISDIEHGLEPVEKCVIILPISTVREIALLYTNLSPQITG